MSFGQILLGASPTARLCPLQLSSNTSWQNKGRLKIFNHSNINPKIFVVKNTLLAKNTRRKNFSFSNYFGDMYDKLAIGGEKQSYTSNRSEILAARTKILQVFQ
ncbi:hypothetical protein [Scytonema sp. NUACC26]|uniref:hypothetical protein n=1 Tax=Scytonema sp. NUACC26 TaxID=3140176 RepID=UPI0038B29164